MNRIVSIILWLVRLAVKIILLPILICLTLVEWICIIAVGFLRMFFSLAGFIIILTAILSFCFELEPASEMRRMIIVGVVFYTAYGRGLHHCRNRFPEHYDAKMAGCRMIM